MSTHENRIVLKRVHLPVDFDGPICAKCEHLSPATDLSGKLLWWCLAGERKIIEPARCDPITGKVHVATYSKRRLCIELNANGDCAEFERSKGSSRPAPNPTKPRTVREG